MGAGFKDFASGAILTAGDVDNYLMRQTVMTFANASARDTALSSVLDEGMVAYLEDIDALTVYNGSAWVAVIDSGNTFTPVVKQGTTTFTVTTSEASYYQINKLVYVIVFVTIATGTGQANQAVTVDLPIATTTVVGSVVGSVFLFDSSLAASYGGQVQINGSTNVSFAGDWGIPFGTTPAIQYTTNDQIRASFCYEVA